MLQKHNKALSNTDVIRDVSISSDLDLGLVANSVNSVRKHDKHNKDHSVWFGAFSEDRLLINFTNVFLNLFLVKNTSNKKLRLFIFRVYFAHSQVCLVLNVFKLKTTEIIY